MKKQSEESNIINVGVTARHGIVDEIIRSPPAGIKYSTLKHIGNPILTGPLKQFESKRHKIIEAFDFPCVTSNRWIYQCFHFSGAATFTLFGEYFPREIRLKIASNLFLKDNFKKLIFSSLYARSSIKYYGNIKDRRILDKCKVVYPAVRKIPDKLLNQRKNNDTVNILMVGQNFFRKGGSNLVDAFEQLQKRYDNIKLRLCSKITSSNKSQIEEYVGRINNNTDITIGLTEREILFKNIYPNADIFVLPTYNESYGFSIEEAMAFGLPVISTNQNAVPEMVKDLKTGFLIGTKQLDYGKEDYQSTEFPRRARNYMTKEMAEKLSILIEDSRLRKRMGKKGLQAAREKFSFEKRNRIMKQVYEEAIR